jgi:hypothetical protein
MDSMSFTSKPYYDELGSALFKLLLCSFRDLRELKRNYPHSFRVFVNYAIHNLVGSECRDFFVRSLRRSILDLENREELAQLWMEAQIALLEDAEDAFGNSCETFHE